MEDGRGLFPLGVETARSFAARRIALAGEAAHVIPPIGAQGLNLGLRDVATISELVVEAHREGRDVGGDDLLARYDRMRRADVTSRTVAVDMLNRSLLSDFLPVQASRGLGLYLIDRIAPLRRALMREGVEPAVQPRLMRGRSALAFQHPVIRAELRRRLHAGRGRAAFRRSASAAPAWWRRTRRPPDARTTRARRNAGHAARLPATP